MTPPELQAQLRRLGWQHADAARELDVTIRTIGRWMAGDVPIPRVVARLLVKLEPGETFRPNT